MPVAGLMNGEELEDYLETRDPKVRKHIRASSQQFSRGQKLRARELLQGVKPARNGRSKRASRPAK
jgi:hypothetical protein